MQPPWYSLDFGGRGQRQQSSNTYNSVNDHNDSESLSVNVDASTVTRPGYIRLNVETEGKLGVGFGDLATGFNRDTVNLVFTIDIPGEVDDKLRSQISSIKSTVGYLPNQFPSTPRDLVPSDLKNLQSVGIKLWTGAFGNRLAGQTPVNWSREFNFEPVPVPNMPNDQWDIDDLPPVKIRVEARPREALQNAASGAFNDRPWDTVRIPMSAFVREVDMGQFSCSELFQDTVANIDSVEQDIRPARERLRQEVNDIESIRDQILSSAGGSSGGRLKDLRPRDIAQLDGSRLQQFKRRAQQAEPEPIDLSSTRSDLSGVQREVDRIELEKCRSNLGDRTRQLERWMSDITDMSQTVRGLKEDIIGLTEGVDILPCADVHPEVDSQIQSLRDDIRSLSFDNPEGIRNTLSDVRGARERVQNRTDSGGGCRYQFESQLDSMESDLKRELQRLGEGGMPEMPDWMQDGYGGETPTCENVSRSIRNQVAGIESEVEQYKSMPARRRRSAERNRILQDGNDTISEIQSRVDSANPCKSELMSRVNQSLSQLESVGSQSEGQAPCSQRYPSAEKQVERFEERVLRMRGVMTKREFDKVISDSENVISTIQRNVPQGDPCRTELVERVRSASRRVGRLNSTIRTRTVVSKQDRKNTRQSLKDLQSRLDQLVGRQQTSIEDMAEDGLLDTV